ncbi:hypothetical protein EMIHUDRAFT_202627 [Emiliania huxleyi CCMP1516]|uniref:Uncharacterized protein n=2 Tax=Emiliania huxleyi TaxID=2903 RepID=A0A0D3K8H8_EMIH1|nr:hypothetical protein EMIHUDRAFT_202627 [Emiliania huxleyi CCMP1516]EOD32063.1 hypothetical protein EMIHUDRAFT_202627 [Emiliania huxleyi CCMP1516]|eukprot:XP_005784492.1 hypothetical protein EMIHUDRAFT_202627 [Emiliania huxleyi CCMP1516]
MLSLYTLAPAYAPVTPAAPLSRAVSGVRRAAPPAAAANSVRDSIATTLLSLGLAAHLTAAPLPAFAEITKADIIAAEQKWGDGIVRVGEVYSKGGDYKMAAKGPVLFKPTKASEKEFRLTPGEAYSYFVTGQEVEDKGFALHPWTKVRFDNKAFVVDGDTAFSMGNYYFTDAKTGEETKALMGAGALGLVLNSLL